METSQKRAAIYFDPDLHRAWRLKAAETDQSGSDLVNRAVKLCLAEDVEDLAACAARTHEPNRPFEEILKDLRQRGKFRLLIKPSAVKDREVIPLTRDRQRVVERISKLAEDPTEKLSRAVAHEPLAHP